MGLMNRMRANTKIVLYVLVFSFGGLWVLQDSGVFESMGINTGRNIAIVNGNRIESELFRNNVQQRMELYRQQGVEITPALQARIEDEVYNALIDNSLRTAELDRLGVQVSDSEVQQAFRGENPDPLILQLFPDGNGGLDRATLEAFIENPAAFGQNEQYLIQLEELVRQNRRQAKLDALISATARVSNAEVEEEFMRRNRRASVQYVAVRYADIPDDQVEVSESELRNYYNENREDFERPRSYQFEYILLEKAPTPEDSTRAIQELNNLKADFVASDDPAAYVQSTAFGDGEPVFVTPGSENVGPTLADSLYADLTVGRTVGPLIDGDNGVLARITDVRPAENPAVRARHILVPSTHEELANTLKAQIQAGEITFENAARQHSTDESNSGNGGDLGWFGSGQMVAPFEQAAFAAGVGEVVGPVETQFGYHLIKVEGRASQEVEIVRLNVRVLGSFDHLLEQAADLQYYAEEEGAGFAEEAQRRNLIVQTGNLLEDQQTIPGLQVGRDALRWLRQSSVGDISEGFDATTAYVVFHVTDITEAGYRPFDEVQSEIEPRVLLEKKREVQVARLQEALESSQTLSAVASAVGQSVQTAENLSLASPMVPGIGREPGFVGTAFGLDAGETSGVIEGQSAAFVLRTTGFNDAEIPELTAEVRQQLRTQLLNRKQQQIRQQWLQNLRDSAEIEDYRDVIL